MFLQFDRLLFIGRTIQSSEVRMALREAAPNARIAVVANRRDELDGALADRAANWVYVRFVPSKTEVERIHEAGRRVFIAGPTVAGEQAKNWRKAAASGVDAILTDYPLPLASVLRERR